MTKWRRTIGAFPVKGKAPDQGREQCYISSITRCYLIIIVAGYLTFCSRVEGDSPQVSSSSMKYFAQNLEQHLDQ